MGSFLPSLGRRKLPMLEIPKLGGGGSTLIARRWFRNTGDTTDTVPAGATRATVRALGAGGGGNTVGGSNYGGYGGGGGAYARGDLPCQPGQVASISMGGGKPTQVTIGGKLVSADYGRSGNDNTVGTGGQAANCIGSIRRSGGTGGTRGYSDGGQQAGTGSPGENGGVGGGSYDYVGGGGGSAGDTGDPDAMALYGNGGNRGPFKDGGGYGGGSGLGPVAVIEYWSA